MKAKELAIELENIILRINKAREEALQEESRIDSLRSDILHHIENDTVNASQGYKYTKALQLVAKERRKVKQESETLQCLQSRLSPISDKIFVATKNAIDKYDRRERDMTLGSDSYKPRVIKSIDKNDILNQVMEILNGDE